jgi:replicative DNA helicase
VSHKITHVLPPRACEVELRVISALTHIGEATNINVQKAMLLLDDHCFQNLDYRQMFEIIRDLFKQGKEFSYVTFISLVPDNIYEIVFGMVKDGYLEVKFLLQDIQQLLHYRAWRKQLKILVDAVNGSMDALTAEESLNVITEQLQRMNQTISTTRKSYLRTYETIADEFLSEECGDDSQFLVDIPNLPPVPNRSLITIAGRSGHGKTFFALYLMDKIIDEQTNKQTLYFNLEMHERVMMERHAKLLGVQGNNRRETISNGISLLLDKNVSIISEPMITIDEIETECRLASLRIPLAVIVVDYLGLIRSKTKSERKDLEQGDIAKRLAALSISLDCVVIALIQVNRDFKNRPVGHRCPMPQDSAESMGSVHSSSWWLGIDQPQHDAEDPQWQDMFQVECRKNRGDSGMFKLRFQFKNGMFSEFHRSFSYKSKEITSGF